MLHPFGPILKSPATFLFLTELFERMLWGGGGGGGAKDYIKYCILKIIVSDFS